MAEAERRFSALGADPGEQLPTSAELALAIVGSFLPLAGVAKAVLEYYSDKGRAERLRALFTQFGQQLCLIEEALQQSQAEVREIRSRMESADFQAGARLAALEASIAADPERVGQFATLLANSLAPEGQLGASGDLSSYVRTLAELGTADMQVLALLEEIDRPVVAVYPNLHDPKPFLERVPELERAANQRGIHPDEFYSHCRRLEGFGLATELRGGPPRMARVEYSFRPTRRGLRLVSLLRPTEGAVRAPQVSGSQGSGITRAT